jgi:hypothetical protein
VRKNGERCFSSPEKVGPSDLGLRPVEIYEGQGRHAPANPVEKHNEAPPSETVVGGNGFRRAAHAPQTP